MRGREIAGVSMDKTTVPVLMYSIIAAFIMNLTYTGRLNPELPCTVFLRKMNGNCYRTANKTKQTPRKPYAAGEAVIFHGQPGGPKRVPCDGLPGVKTVWTGLEKLNILLSYREWKV
jgi:hypothetical protein